MNKILLSIHEASKLCGIDDKKISDEIRNGNIKVFRLPGMKNPKIPFEELKSWIEKNSYYQSVWGVYEIKV